MAHNFSIPFSFEFTPEHKKWLVLTFTIVGREQDFKPEPAKFPGTDIPMPMIGLPVMQERNGPVIQFSSGRGIPLLSSEKLYRAGGSEEASFINALAKLAFRGRTIPPELTSLIVSDGSDPTLSKRHLDAWTMRDELFKLEESPRSLARFINKWGEWGWPITSFHRMLSGTEALKLMLGEREPRFLLPATVWRQREEYRAALLGDPAAWLSTKARLGVTHQRSEYPYLGITVRTCTQAIEATITLDHLRKVRSRICARPDCNSIFTVESDHGKIYCEQYCGHLVSVRRKRAAAKKAAKTTGRKKV